MSGYREGPLLVELQPIGRDPAEAAFGKDFPGRWLAIFDGSQVVAARESGFSGFR